MLLEIIQYSVWWGKQRWKQDQQSGNQGDGWMDNPLNQSKIGKNTKVNLYLSEKLYFF